MKSLASISLDLDNEWTYLKIHGEESWSDYPSYLHLAVPYILDLFEEHGLKVTWFLVGKDATLPAARGYLRMISDYGHEIGNHSFSHEPWLDTYPRADLEEELRVAHEAIAEATGQEPIGFRGPGYSHSPELIDILCEMGYRFDASSLPTFIGPIARRYYFRTASLSRTEREVRNRLFGSFRDGFKPNKSFIYVGSNGERLAEIPVTTIPGLRTPFHLSYLLYLYGYSEALMLSYLRTAIFMCRVSNTTPSFLLHPLDFLDGKQVPGLNFFPAMQIDRRRKEHAFELVLAELKGQFELRPMSDHAAKTLGDPEAPVRKNQGSKRDGTRRTQHPEAVRS